MNVTFAAEDEKLNDVEVISELPGPRGYIVGPLCQSTNQRLAVTCEGSFPFPFQAEDLINESEVKTCMQEIDFYCRKCRKSLKMTYCLCGDNDAPAMRGIILRCHTRKCTRVVTLKHFTEGQIKTRTDALGKCYL